MTPIAWRRSRIRWVTAPPSARRTKPQLRWSCWRCQSARHLSVARAGAGTGQLGGDPHRCYRGGATADHPRRYGPSAGPRCPRWRRFRAGVVCAGPVVAPIFRACRRDARGEIRHGRSELRPSTSSGPVRCGARPAGRLWVRRRGGSGRELLWFPEPVSARDCYRAALADTVLLYAVFQPCKRITSRMSATRRDRFTAGLPMLTPPHREGGIGAVRVEIRGLVVGAKKQSVVGVSGTNSGWGGGRCRSRGGLGALPGECRQGPLVWRELDAPGARSGRALRTVACGFSDSMASRHVCSEVR